MQARAASKMLILGELGLFMKDVAGCGPHAQREIDQSQGDFAVLCRQPHGELTYVQPLWPPERACGNRSLASLDVQVDAPAPCSQELEGFRFRSSPHKERSDSDPNLTDQEFAHGRA